MNGLVNSILQATPVVAYVVVGLLVFAEDAIFVGFVVPGETAAVLGGVVASRANAHVSLMIVIVVVAAIVGDTVGYEVGRHFGSRLLKTKILRKRHAKIGRAQEALRQRGGRAVFFGRFTAFLRAVVPALAGASRMPYRRFLGFNAIGGAIWGTAYVLLGFAAGDSYAFLAKRLGGYVGILVGVIVVAVAVIYLVRRHRKHRREGSSPRPEIG